MCVCACKCLTERHIDILDEGNCCCLGCLRSHVNTWHASATLYSAPAARLLQRGGLETWQQPALSSLLGAQPSHLLPFFFTAQSSESTWLGWDVMWQLTLAVEERFLWGPHSSGEDGGLCVPHHDMLICNFLLVNGLISASSCGFVIMIGVLYYEENAWFRNTTTFSSESWYRQAGWTIPISVVWANCYSRIRAVNSLRLPSRCSTPTPMKTTTDVTKRWILWPPLQSTSWRRGWRNWSSSP